MRIFGGVQLDGDWLIQSPSLFIGSGSLDLHGQLANFGGVEFRSEILF
jgi:hypothetical protein